jgi:hypothetical protein
MDIAARRAPDCMPMLALPVIAQDLAQPMVAPAAVTPRLLALDADLSVPGLCSARLLGSLSMIAPLFSLCRLIWRNAYSVRRVIDSDP